MQHLAQSGAPELIVQLRSYTALAVVGVVGLLLLLLTLVLAVSSVRTEANPNPGIVHRIIAPSVIGPIGAILLVAPLVMTGSIMKDNDRTVEIAVARAWPSMNQPSGLTDEGDHAVTLDDHPEIACTLTVLPSGISTWEGRLRCGDRLVPPRKGQ